MAQKRINKDHVLSNAEKQRRHLDKVASIDKDMDEALQNIDWNRRNQAELSLSNFVETYLMDSLFEVPPSSKMRQVMQSMFDALADSKPFQVMLPRGSGKSVVATAMLLYLIATGKRKFAVIVSQSARSASLMMKDFYYILTNKESKFAQDYPHVCLPFILCHGSTRRLQMYHGRDVGIERNSTTISLPRLVDEQGKEFPTFGSVITCRGVTSGLRGMRQGKIRPDVVLIDDIQSHETAHSPEQVEKLWDILTRDILNLSSGRKMAVICTSTPIAEDDLTARIENDKNWKTEKYPAIIKYPLEMKKAENGLWGEYFKIYDNELVANQKHEESLAFYREHFDAMNEGAETFADRYKKDDGEISGIQSLLCRRHLIGEQAFDAEYQMRPFHLQLSLPISPQIVASRISNLKELEIPKENVLWVCASSDLNLSKFITTTIVVFMRDQTATVIWHKFRRCSIPANIPEQDYYQRVYNLLAKHGQELKQLGIRIDAWVIDGNGQPYNAVVDFVKKSKQICGITAGAFIGKASHQYRSFVRTRLKEEVNRTLLCGNEDEHKVAGSGRKYTFFDSDLYHEKAQKGFLQALGNVGSISWYQGGDHSTWAVQVCSEKLVMKKAKGDGTTVYTWKEIGADHDALDSIGQALAAFGSMGFATTGGEIVSKLRRKLPKPKNKIRIV